MHSQAEFIQMKPMPMSVLFVRRELRLHSANAKPYTLSLLSSVREELKVG